MTPPTPYSVAFAAAARRGMNRLPEHVAAALFEHLTGALASNPHRLGKPLDKPYDGIWSTRRGEYRAFYTIDDDQNTISIVAVDHRRDAYRRR
ncbi:MAG: type II toxin-antitoxin system RelE family toxin [Pseudonocardiales bacterium]